MGSRNPGAFDSARDAAIAAIVSLKRDVIWAAQPIENRTLSAIARIDSDVLFGEIAGPEPGFAARPALDYKTNRNFVFVHLALQPRLGELGGAPRLAHERALKVDVDAVRVELDTGIAGGRQDAAPIWVGPGDGGLEQRRVGDGTGDLACRGIVGSAFYFDGDQLSGALAIAGDLYGQALEDLLHGGGEVSP